MAGGSTGLYPNVALIWPYIPFKGKSWAPLAHERYMLQCFFWRRALALTAAQRMWTKCASTRTWALQSGAFFPSDGGLRSSYFDTHFPPQARHCLHTDLPFWLIKGGFKVGLCTFLWYRSSCNTGFDNSETASPAIAVTAHRSH